MKTYSDIYRDKSLIKECISIMKTPGFIKMLKEEYKRYFKQQEDYYKRLEAIEHED